MGRRGPRPQYDKREAFARLIAEMTRDLGGIAKALEGAACRVLFYDIGDQVLESNRGHALSIPLMNPSCQPQLDEIPAPTV